MVRFFSVQQVHQMLSSLSLLSTCSRLADRHLQWLNTLRDVGNEGPRRLAVLFALRNISGELVAQALLLDCSLAE
jgi:hypothetical protein